MARATEVGYDEAFRSLLESSTAAIIALQPDGTVAMWSRGAERILGWRREEAVGRRLPGLPVDRRAQFDDIRRRVLDGETMDGLRVMQRRRDGAPVDLWLSVSPLRDGDGGVRGILGLMSERADDGPAEVPARIRELEQRLSELRVSSLQDRLSPHFLLNSLHAVGVLLRKGEVDDGVRMLSRLGEMLRLLLAGSDEHEVPLRQEAAFVERYLEVERLRFGGDLRAEVCIEDGVEDALVPSLLLQPLVENAVRHGIASRTGGGSVRITARRCRERVLLEVLDDGRGLPTGFDLESADGIGLSATTERLRELYRGQAGFEIADRAEGGVRVAVTLPLRRASTAARASDGTRSRNGGAAARESV